MKTKVLITGGAGFIGSNTANRLIKLGYDVTVVDSLIEQIHGAEPFESTLFKSLDSEVKFVHGSVLDRELMRRLIMDAEIVIHLAAETGTGQSMYHVSHYSEVNIMGTSIMLDIIVNNPNAVKKIIVASSRSIYGEGKYSCSKHGVKYPVSRDTSKMDSGIFSFVCNECEAELFPQATDEATPLNPKSIYGITKLSQEQMILNVAESLGISAIALRYQNVYGPGQSLANPYTGILSIFSNLILSDQPVNVFEDGLESRDFIYITDVVQANISAVQHAGNKSIALNIGSGSATSVIQVVKSLYAIYNKEENYFISGNYRIGDIRHNFADTAKANSEIGFEAKVNFNEGVKKFAKWVESQELPKLKYDVSISEMRAKNLLK